MTQFALLFTRRLIRLTWMLAVRAGMLLAALLVLRAGLALRFRGLTYDHHDVPERRAAIIFGARVYRSGHPSAMLADRVATGADLYFAGKVDVLLMTGDHSTFDYNEPEAMRQYALQLGVPDEAIVLDYGGRRTYDSCYRARHIFGLREAILVTQNFHLDRALMTCRALGLDAVGVFADYQRPRYSRVSLAISRTRELPAIVLAIFDILRGQPSPVMGDRLPIFSGK